MKRILFDANVPFKCRVFLAHHEVHTAQRIGWRLKENGDLIRSAERAGYDVLVSCDQNIEYQAKPKRTHDFHRHPEHEQARGTYEGGTAYHCRRGGGDARQLHEG